MVSAEAVGRGIAAWCLVGSFAVGGVPAQASSRRGEMSRSVGAVSKRTFNPTQRRSAEAALKSLRKLKAATDVGVSLLEYRRRLIDTKADVDENLRAFPASPVKSKITDAMQSYQDAGAFWNECLQLEYVQVLNEAQTAKIMKKYKLSWGEQPKDEIDAMTRKVSEGEKQVFLSVIWKSADASMEAASRGLGR